MKSKSDLPGGVLTAFFFSKAAIKNLKYIQMCCRFQLLMISLLNQQEAQKTNTTAKVTKQKLNFTKCRCSRFSMTNMRAAVRFNLELVLRNTIFFGEKVKSWQKHQLGKLTLSSEKPNEKREASVKLTASSEKPNEK